MTMKRRTIKARSHESIRQAKPDCALVALIYLAITYALSALENKLAGTAELLTAAMTGESSMAALHAMSGGSTFRSLLSVVVSLASTVVGAGFTVYARM